MRSSPSFIAFSLLFIALLPSIQAHAPINAHFRSLSPFSSALETLQKQLGYTFKKIGLLRRAMTHASFSEENNKALAVLGGSVIETAVSFKLLSKDIDVSASELNKMVSRVSNVESSCAVDGTRLSLHKVVRVAPNTNASAPSVVCGAFRAIFGAIAIDTGNSDDAGSVFWNLHGDLLGHALSILPNAHSSSPSCRRISTASLTLLHCAVIIAVRDARQRCLVSSPSCQHCCCAGPQCCRPSSSPHHHFATLPPFLLKPLPSTAPPPTSLPSTASSLAPQNRIRRIVGTKLF
ncbi:protein NUCLEAR FUSION DEFECTIVE 2 isoform X2 [Arachis hypogaea]|uniref:protein NUCLEAR FUSION DEFECTIVE 2 isoform X2 n=1 Tax=Arachis hypogaea TaxID=3818 RepID=UPI000DECD256|nr:protein NUCLEAR FUSION DEFECTIVE 2 isoform X2 [Arachis hypogaea]